MIALLFDRAICSDLMWLILSHNTAIAIQMREAWKFKSRVATNYHASENTNLKKLSCRRKPRRASAMIAAYKRKT